MSEHEVEDVAAITATHRKPAEKKSVFEVTYRTISNPHKAQFYLDWGMGRKGPWATVGLNELEYMIGYKDKVPQRVAKEGGVTPLTAV